MTEFMAEHLFATVTAIVVGFASLCYIFTIAVKSNIREVGIEIGKRIRFWLKK